jgi:hypothetical protein
VHRRIVPIAALPGTQLVRLRCYLLRAGLYLLPRPAVLLRPGAAVQSDRRLSPVT